MTVASGAAQMRLPRYLAHRWLTLVRRWLTWRNLSYAAAACGLVYLAATFTSYSAVLSGRTALTEDGLIGGDYVAFHAAGRLLLNGEGSLLYDRARVAAVEAVTTDGRLPTLYDPYRNPPFFAVPFAPLSLLDRVPSFAVWTLLNVGILVLAVWLALRTLPSLQPRWRRVACLVFGFAPVYFGLVDGQNSCLSLLLYVLVYRALLGGRDGQAGVWAALGLFKPQLFFLLPLVFVATRRWKAVGTYAATVLALAVLSYALVGVDGLLGWVHIIVGYEGGNAAKQASRMYSLKAFWDLLLPGFAPVALGLWLASSAAVVGLLLRVWRGATAAREGLALRWAFTIVAGVLVDPHLLDYDLTVLVLAGLLLATALPESAWWVLGVYVLTLADGPLHVGGQTVQLAVLVLAALAVRVWWRVEGEAGSGAGARADSALRPWRHPALGLPRMRRAVEVE